jgi:hypothetical protein
MSRASAGDVLDFVFAGNRPYSGQLLRAMRWLGPDGMDQQVIDRLRKILPMKAKKELKLALGSAPIWLQPKVREIVANRR